MFSKGEQTIASFWRFFHETKENFANITLLLQVAVSMFTYLGSIMDEKDGTDSDVLSRINKSRAACASLKPVWRSTVISLKSKIRLLNSNVKTILLCGSECWKISKEITIPTN